MIDQTLTGKPVDVTRRRRCIITLGLALAVVLTSTVFLTAPAVAESGQASSIGRRIGDFTLPDHLGNDQSLSEFADRRAVVVCFLGTDCPLAKFYGPRLQKMSDQLADEGVEFIGINSNMQDSLSEIAGFSRRHDISFPMLKDLRGDVAETFGATRTPEVFLLDKDRVVRYQGRVDQQFTFGAGVGLALPNETRNDLKIAIEELLAGKAISVAQTPSKGCLIGRVNETVADPTITYTKHISRLVQQHCQKCHREGQIAPFALDSYDEVAGWGQMISEVVFDKRMPPWHAGKKSTLSFLNDARLSDEEKDMFYQWVDDGCPEGDPADLPEPRVFADGWFTDGGEDAFDHLVHISPETVPVKAEGIEEYRYYEVDGFDEDKWIKTIECKPGNQQVVHHIILYARPPGGEPIKPGSTGISTRHFAWLAGFAPGTRPLDMPKGWARLLPAGYSLVFEMHYTPIGTAQRDRSAVGMVFMDGDEVERVLYTSAALNHDFVIPAGEEKTVEAERRFDRDTLLLALYPHMHVRGKSFSYELKSAKDKSSEILLDVPVYDFNWQNSYTLAKPMLIPKGSRLHVTAVFDNTDENLANPDPTVDVKWGRQSWEEMMIGFYDQGVTVDEAKKLLAHEAKQLQKERDKKRAQRQASR